MRRRCLACGRVACVCADPRSLGYLLRHARAAWHLLPAYRDGLIRDPLSTVPPVPPHGDASGDGVTVQCDGTKCTQ
jgi:hypothetical protein